MIEVEFTKGQIDLLFAALKEAESGFTTRGNFKACKELTKMYSSIHKQVFTYGQLEEEND